MNIVVVGSNGRLGSQIVKDLKEEKNKVYEVDLSGLIKGIDLITPKAIDGIIDVSCATNSIKTAEFAKKHHIPLAIGCTGHNEEELKEIEKASKQTSILLCYNFAFGVNALKLALKSLLKYSPKSAYTLEIHHKNKKDAPSGTAKDLEKIINKFDVNLYPTVSIRESSIVGKHSIDLYWDDEHITITHEAITRNCFSSGAIKALKLLVTAKNGLYSLDDLINNS